MVKQEPMPEKDRKDRYAHYLSYATFASNVAFVGAVLFEFGPRNATMPAKVAYGT